MSAPLVLRVDDPRAEELLAAGRTVAHRSWGARLAAPLDEALLRGLVATAEERGYAIRELGPGSDAAVVELEDAVRDDYPGGPATAPGVRTLEGLASDRAAGTRCFGAERGGVLVAVTGIRRVADHAETDWTSVAAEHRGRRLAEAVKAASLMALAADGARVFGTGGSDENAAGLAMNRRLGYVVSERWITFADLAGSGDPPSQPPRHVVGRRGEPDPRRS